LTSLVRYHSRNHSLLSEATKILFLSCLLHPCLADEASATSIVCLRSPDSVVMAADSMLTVRKGSVTSVSKTECKILRSGSYFFSLSGFYKDPARGYDAIETVRGAVDEESTFSENADLAADGVSRGLTAELVRLKSEAPGAFSDIKSRGGTLLNLLFTGFQDGTAQVALLKFRQGASASGEVTLAVERTACPGDCNAQTVEAFYLTDTRAIEAYQKKGHAIDWHSPETAAKFLVNLVIDAHTPGVAAPVDVLRIDKDGARWIEHKEQCPELPEAPDAP
jgi:hypothetical protein